MENKSPDIPQDPTPPSILLVEDDVDIRNVISHSLSTEGYSIREAEDGRVGMRACEESLPDLIITDIKMPHVDGKEFVKWFRANYQDPFVPILMLTALTDIDTIVQGLELGADDYLTKPFHHRELRARVHALLRVKDLTNLLASKTRELQKAQAALLAQERKLVAAQMAGAAAHNLGQPVTTILLNCRLLENALNQEDGNAEMIPKVVKGIQDECAVIKTILENLSRVDPENTESYVGSDSILAIDTEEPS